MPRRPRRGGLPEWLAQSQLPVFVVDARRVVLFFNQGCEQLTGWAASDLIGNVCEWRSDGNAEEPATLLSALCPPSEPVAATHRVHLLTRSGQSLDRIVRFHPLQPTAEAEREDEPLRWLGVIEVPEAAQFGSTSADSRLHAELSAIKSELKKRYSLADVVAHSSAMRRVLTQLQLAIGSYATVGLQGAAGTGKQHLARAVHYAGETRVQAFVPVDCRMPRDELSKRLSQIIATDREAPPIPVLRLGAVLLQHVEALPTDWQARLIEWITSDAAPEKVRWMISSSERFSTLVEREVLLPEFRDRFAVVEVSLPTLRERRDEFPLLAQQALECGNHSDKQVIGFSPDVWEQFRAYNWPGNLEEMFAVVSEAHARCTGAVITVADLPFRFRAGRDGQSVAPLPSAPQIPLEERLMQVEREQLILALERSGGNKQSAAESLGIPRAKLYRRLEAHGLLKGEDDEVL